jgi:hypothetical protein
MAAFEFHEDEPLRKRQKFGSDAEEVLVSYLNPPTPHLLAYCLILYLYSACR